jgi:hypothetical protein
MQGEVRAQAKKRLSAMLKAAVGGLVVAAATLVTPAPASASPAAQQTSLAERVQELRKQALATDGQNAAEEMLVAFNNWGNHWNNWNNWHNWHNWVNHH